MDLSSFLHTSPFYELTALLVLGALVGGLGHIFRMPMIFCYIAAGILAGPSVLGIVRSRESIDQLAELSIALLLFLVGMKIDLQKVKNLGSVSFFTGLGQVLLTAVFGLGISYALGFDTTSSLYIATALTFSSTIIVVKLLSDRQEVDSLHGRISIGVLIIQDIIVILVLMALSATSGDLVKTEIVTNIASKLVYSALIITFLAFFIRYLAKPLVQFIIQNSELVIIFAISWTALFAAIGSYLGFSKELGGLLAGVSLASTPFRESIVSRLAPLRDFLLLFFFISLGSQVYLNNLGTHLVPAIVLSLFILIGKPVIVMTLLRSLGYRKRTGMLTGITLGQISEFSLILIALGQTLGHIGSDIVGLVTLISLLTIAISIYLITFSHTIYGWFEPYLSLFEKKIPYREDVLEDPKVAKKTYDVIMFGLGRYGAAIGTHLKERKLKTLGIDYDPEAVKRWKKLGFDATYGDAWDHEFMADLPIQNAKFVISATPIHDFGFVLEDPREALIDNLKKLKYKGKIVVSAHHHDEAKGLKKHGADIVLLPFYDAAERAVEKMMD